ncbi:MAG TPA: hypothetical protein VK969_09645 [Acidimicrobiia bacterium]|nr:hypothetical protein [Acidimicrobiia bacterium]
MFTSNELANAILSDRRRLAAEARQRRVRIRQDRRDVVWIGLLVAASIVFGGCANDSADISSPVSEAEAVEMAQGALEGFNSRDYATWSQNWSASMKSAIGEDAFLTFRDQFHGQLGDFVAITGVRGAPGRDRGTFRWTYDLEFEEGSYQMWFGFKDGSSLIEGVSFEDPGV